MPRILSTSATPKPGLPSFVPEPQFWVHHDASTNEVKVLKQKPADPGERLELNFSPMGWKRLRQSVPAILIRLHQLWTRFHDPQFRSGIVTMITVSVTLVFFCAYV
mmetsp:Transcript_96346/g.155452  ORF Transcript_96346/g.155452 Transcript_96346/m.155452 type:complete len:106 (+) Transcript_96346:1150-1467(+)